MVPLRLLFRSRWWALAWCVGICTTAVQFAGGGQAGLMLDAANSADGNAAQASALAAEDPE